MNHSHIPILYYYSLTYIGWLTCIRHNKSCQHKVKRIYSTCPGGAPRLAGQTSEYRQQNHVLIKEMFWKVLWEQEKGG